jgi:hypothetical protein
MGTTKEFDVKIDDTKMNDLLSELSFTTRLISPLVGQKERKRHTYRQRGKSSIQVTDIKKEHKLGQKKV